MTLRILFGVVALLLASGCVRSAHIDTKQPTPVTASRDMVVTAHPLATQAGMQILEEGGTAADAMIAVQLVLGLVEPQSSGMGGGAFVVYYDAESGQTITVDAREKAPAAARGERFYIDGQPMSFFEAWQSGLSVGVPGVPRLLEHMHQHYGRLPWPELFAPASRLARQGFELSGRTSSLVADLLERNPSCKEVERLFFRDAAAFAYFVDGQECTAKPPGSWMTNKAYAQTLAMLARQGMDAFYTGALAEAIVEAVQGDPRMPGDLTAADLMSYRVVERAPVCIDFQGYQVCGMGPPSSGGVAVAQILGIMEKRLDMLGATPLDVASVHLFTQAMRLAFADRNRFVADNDFFHVPLVGLLDDDYLAERASLITAVDMGRAEPGIPPGFQALSGDDGKIRSAGTSHVSIIDRHGNALSMTSSIESAFGNGVLVKGFFLNNQLTDFSFAFEDAAGRPVANRVEPDKRPRSSMAPTIVFDNDGQVALITGSPGGARIIGYTAQSIMNIILFGMSPQQAVQVPHYMNLNGRTEIEQPIPGITLNYDAQALASALVARGHSDPGVPPEERSVGIIEQASGLAIIQVGQDDSGKAVLLGGADPRRDGVVGGR